MMLRGVGEKTATTVRFTTSIFGVVVVSSSTRLLNTHTNKHTHKHARFGATDAARDK
jgi:hypothetical protein